MACNITSNRTEPCKDSLGGNKKAFFINYIEDAFTVTAGEATAINVAVTDVFQYDLRADGNTAVESPVSNKNTGTTVNTQTITLALKKQDKDTSLEVDLMAKGRPIIVMQDRNGNYKAFGISEGMDLTASDINSGGAQSDFNGYNLTFTAMEGSLAPFLDSETITALEGLVSETTITP